MVSAVIKVHYYLGLPERHFKVVRPLLRLLKTAPPEVQAVVLDDCAVLAGQRPVSHAVRIQARLLTPSCAGPLCGSPDSILRSVLSFSCRQAGQIAYSRGTE